MTPYLILRITARTISSLRFTVSVTKVHSCLVAAVPTPGPTENVLQKRTQPHLSHGSRREEPHAPAARVEDCPRPLPFPSTRLPDLQGPSALTLGAQPLLPHRPSDGDSKSLLCPRGDSQAGLMCTCAECIL